MDKCSKNFINFINVNEGNAYEGNPLNIKARIDYNIVEKFLKKEINLDSLKSTLGC